MLNVVVLIVTFYLLFAECHYAECRYAECPDAVFLVVCDPSVNELGATYTHRDIFIDLSRSLTAHSKEGRTQLKIRPLTVSAPLPFCCLYFQMILQLLELQAE
jgi:hypothetical protein